MVLLELIIEKYDSTPEGDSEQISLGKCLLSCYLQVDEELIQ